MVRASGQRRTSCTPDAAAARASAAACGTAPPGTTAASFWRTSRRTCHGRGEHGSKSQLAAGASEYHPRTCVHMRMLLKPPARRRGKRAQGSTASASSRRLPLLACSYPGRRGRRGGRVRGWAGAAGRARRRRQRAGLTGPSPRVEQQQQQQQQQQEHMPVGRKKGTHAVTLPPPPLFPINHLRELGEVSPRESASQRHGPAGSDWSQQQASPAHYKAVQRTTAA